MDEKEKNIDDILKTLKQLDKNDLLLVNSCVKILEARQSLEEDNVREIV